MSKRTSSRRRAAADPLIRRGPFRATLGRIRGKGGWTYITVPKSLTPPITRPSGRTPVHVIVDGVVWDTSICRVKTGEGFLTVPKRVRGTKEEGDRVMVEFAFEDDK
jgi:Domain of unknown function (DUF1905)